MMVDDEQQVQQSAQASIYGVSLCISPAAVERGFWRVHTPTYASTDSLALIIGTVNLYSAWQLASYMESERTKLAMYAGLAFQGSIAIGARLCLSLAPERYYGIRHELAVTQRVLRSMYLLVFYLYVDWPAYLAHRAEGDSPASAFNGTMVVTFCVLVMHTLLFPVPFYYGAPLQIFFCVTACCSLRSFACVVRSGAEYAEAARLMCHRTQAAKQLLLTAMGASWAQQAQLCEAAAPELLLSLTSAMGAFVPLYILYWRERHLKASYIAARRPWPDAPLNAARPPFALFFAAGLVGTVLAGFAVADAAATWGPKYSCEASAS